MTARFSSGYGYGLLAMLMVFLLLRLLFSQFDPLKLGFIYAAGLLVQSFMGSGSLLQGEWVFTLGGSRFVLDESCSGTTFFCLLVAFLILRRFTHGIRLWWLLAAFPIAVTANAVRVVTAMYLHAGFNLAGIQGWHDVVHVLTGVFTFLTLLIALSWWLERNTGLDRG